MAVAQPWTLTLRQYERAIMDDYMERTGEDACSKAEYLRCYPNDCRRSEWVREIEVAAQHGEIIPPKVLDAAVDRYQLAEDRIDDLEGLIRDFRAALGMIDRFRNLPPITDEELDDLEVLWERDTLRDQAYDALRHAQDDLLKAVVD